MVADMADPADIQRLLGDLAREGTVVSVDLDAGTARVQFEDLITGDIPWLMPRAGKTRIYSPPSIGEQVLVIAPEADTDRCIIAGSLSSNAHPNPAQDGSTTIAFEDGARLAYDPATHALTIALPSGGTAAIVADGGLSVKGPLSVDGPVDVTGKLTASDDVVGGGKSLKSHVHDKVQPGQAVTGKPL